MSGLWDDLAAAGRFGSYCTLGFLLGRLLRRYLSRRARADGSAGARGDASPVDVGHSSEAASS